MAPACASCYANGAIILGIGGDNSPWAGGIFVSQPSRTFIVILRRHKADWLGAALRSTRA